MVSALVIATVLLMLGSALLGLVRQTRLAVSRGHAGRQAFYAARAGGLWYEVRGLPPVSVTTNTRRVVLRAGPPEVAVELETLGAWLRMRRGSWPMAEAPWWPARRS